MAANKIARKDSRFRVISILPDFCFVPGLAAPVPFPLFADLGGAVKVAKDVLINGRPAFVYNVWGRYYFDTFRKKAKEGENFKGNKNLNRNLGKSGFDTFRCKVGRN